MELKKYVLLQLKRENAMLMQEEDQMQLDVLRRVQDKKQLEPLRQSDKMEITYSFSTNINKGKKRVNLIEIF